MRERAAADGETAGSPGAERRRSPSDPGASGFLLETRYHPRALTLRPPAAPREGRPRSQAAQTDTQGPPHRAATASEPGLPAPAPAPRPRHRPVSAPRLRSPRPAASGRAVSIVCKHESPAPRVLRPQRNHPSARSTEVLTRPLPRVAFDCAGAPRLPGLANRSVFCLSRQPSFWVARSARAQEPPPFNTWWPRSWAFSSARAQERSPRWEMRPPQMLGTCSCVVLSSFRRSQNVINASFKINASSLSRKSPVRPPIPSWLP